MSSSGESIIESKFARVARERIPTIVNFEPISVIVPTIGRPQSLFRLLDSLASQTVRVQEVVVADSSCGYATARITGAESWEKTGLVVNRICVQPAHAVRQREAAIAVAKGALLLLLDDDVELEPTCVEEMVAGLNANPDVVAVMADLRNQPWPGPTRAWRTYLRL